MTFLALEDWFTALDRRTTSEGVTPSEPDCKTLGSSKCEQPTTECKEFTPPERELFF
jgi:hypothetical protein